MLPRNHPDRIQITFDDRRLVANAGCPRPPLAGTWPARTRSGMRLDLLPRGGRTRATR